MGPSGSGKSTLMHILAGLDKPTTGTVAVSGTEITTLKDSDLTKLRRRHIGFVFQFFNLLPMLTAEENITLPLSIAGEKPDPAYFGDLIQKVGLADRLHHRPSELSGGQQQRVAIARASHPPHTTHLHNTTPHPTPHTPIHPPPPLPLPPSRPLTTGPDSRRPAAARRVAAPRLAADGALRRRADRQPRLVHRHEILALMRDSVDSYGQTTVMVTHEPRAAAIADRILFLADGLIVRDLPGATQSEVLSTLNEIAAV